mmetsp:Transcript_485/g.2280  ORF Transcript_485/g.2280 Transcript_485/m.2280 type:complete len:274 (-) Transcript_485:132-953(-)
MRAEQEGVAVHVHALPHDRQGQGGARDGRAEDARVGVSQTRKGGHQDGPHRRTQLVSVRHGVHDPVLRGGRDGPGEADAVAAVLLERGEGRAGGGREPHEGRRRGLPRLALQPSYGAEVRRGLRSRAGGVQARGRAGPAAALARRGGCDARRAREAGRRVRGTGAHVQAQAAAADAEAARRGSRVDPHGVPRRVPEGAATRGEQRRVRERPRGAGRHRGGLTEPALHRGGRRRGPRGALGVRVGGRSGAAELDDHAAGSEREGRGRDVGGPCV